MGATASDQRGALADVPRLVSPPGQAVREFRIPGAEATIGSDPASDFVVDDPTVSARHARIRRHHGRWLISDLGSTNGTIVNGTRIARETALARADKIRLGTVQFTFDEPQAPGFAMRPRLRAAVVGLLAMLLAALAMVAGRKEVRDLLSGRRAPAAPATTAQATPAMGSTWIARLNYYRMISGLNKVEEDPGLSQGDLAHARYLVANEAGAIRSGRIGPSFHREDPARPLFTAAGKAAAAISAVDAVFTDPPEDPAPEWAIENWITGPFHRLWILNPALARAGYGQFCSDGICAAALNVQSGITASAQASGPPAPVMFPPQGAAIHNGAFTAEESEWPDPLAPCAGYANPTGIPITLALGGPAAVILDAYSISRNGAPLAACGFDADSYRAPDQPSKDRVRRELTHFGAVIVVPRQPLTAGATYTVSIEASGKSYSWRFAVAP